MKRQSVRGIVYGEDFISVRTNIKQKAVRDPGDDDDDKTVAIPIHQDGEIEIHSEFCRQIKIETDLRHRGILLKKSKVIGASTELVTTPAMKIQERLAGGQHLEQTTCSAIAMMHNK